MKYAQINLFDIANGVGIRVSLFVSGCGFNCPGCFNQQAQSFSYGAEFTPAEEQMILTQLQREDFDGLSILGGDPFWQDDDDIIRLQELCDKVHSLGKDVWMWTGYEWNEILGNQKLFDLASHCDYLVDGRFEKDKKNLALAWRGSSNQRIIDVKKTLKGDRTCVIQKE